MFSNLNIQYNPEYSYLTNSWYAKLVRVNNANLLDRASEYLKIWTSVNDEIKKLKDFYFINSNWKTNILTINVASMDPWSKFKILFNEYTKIVWIVYNEQNKIQDANIVAMNNKYLIWNNGIFIDEKWTKSNWVNISPDWSNNLYDIMVDWIRKKSNTFYLYNDDELMRWNINKYWSKNIMFVNWWSDEIHNIIIQLYIEPYIVNWNNVTIKYYENGNWKKFIDWVRFKIVNLTPNKKIEFKNFLLFFDNKYYWIWKWFNWWANIWFMNPLIFYIR